MNSSQIIVRSKLMQELLNARFSGIKHGKFLLVSSAQVEAEIERRKKIRANMY